MIIFNSYVTNYQRVRKWIHQDFRIGVSFGVHLHTINMT